MRRPRLPSRSTTPRQLAAPKKIVGGTKKVLIENPSRPMGQIQTELASKVGVGFAEKMG